MTAADRLEEALAEIERLRAENDRFRKTLEIIAEKATDKLQRAQSIGALTNIGPKAEAKK